METKLWNRVLKAKALLEPRTLELLSKYKARSTFASGLRNAPNESLGIESAESYFVLLKLSLAYSSLELLKDATGKSSALKVTNFRVSYELASGKFHKLLLQIEQATPSLSKVKVQNILTRLTAKSSGIQTENLYEFIGLCSHLMSHGIFTPAGSGLSRSRYHRQLLLGLSNEALRAGDAFLEAWIAKKERKVDQPK